MGPTGATYRVVQVHPTRHCNLTCLHCYSSSGPDQHESIPVDLLCQAMSDAASAGYSAMGVSGGEPLVYPGLRALLGHAQSLGMITTVTSNGMLLDHRRLSNLAGVTSLLAISLDGRPESHNRMRNHPRAFETMASRLEGVRQSGIPFGFIFTLTQYNLDELEWVAQFAVEQRAALLQVHPLEQAGRAITNLADSTPDHIEASFSYVEVLRLKHVLREQIAIQLDYAPREVLRRAPERVLAEPDIARDASRPLADVLSPLVIEPDGMVVPLEFGLSRQFALGSLYDAPLSTLAETWRAECEPAFRDLCRRVHAEAIRDESPTLLNWYEQMHHQALADATPA
jgi:MoaA/NifB/PqqE/SkfB family radical SAM enzyme